MDINLKVLVSILGISMGLILIWLVYIMDTNSKLAKELEFEQEKFRSLDAFNEVILYELDTARDSVRIMQLRLIEAEENESN